MSVRAQIEKYPKATVGVVAVALLIAIYIAMPHHADLSFHPPKYAFFSDDDGKTYFVDDYSKIAPFDHGGKEADFAHVFMDKNGNRFVGYLERATSSAAKERIERARRDMLVMASREALPTPDATLMDQIAHDTEAKSPGGTKWVSKVDPNVRPIVMVHAPDGSAPTEVSP